MKKVKLSINSPREGLLRQTPQGDGVWGDYQFYINETVDECDYWVVYSKGETRPASTRVPPENLYLITGEPESIYHYSKRFTNLFPNILTSRTDIKGASVRLEQPAQPWWVGRRMQKDSKITFTLDYADLERPVVGKRKLISVISSLKAFTRGHKERIRFVKKLSEHFGERIDVFGKGINTFEDKWDTLKDYKYHIVLENSSVDNYWTEKLADCYLAECFPFYHGAPNIRDYFPARSLELIDIRDFDRTVERIESCLTNNLYEERKRELREAKDLILNKYNLFAVLVSHFENNGRAGEKAFIRLKNEKNYLDLFKLPMYLKRVLVKYFG